MNKKVDQDDLKYEMEYKDYDREEYLMLVWWMYNAEQLKEKLTDEEKEEINALIRKRLKEDPHAELWEI